MTITVRIDDELLALLDGAAARHGVERSEVVRRAVRRYCRAAPGTAPPPATLAAGLLGSLRSGRGDLSTTSREDLTRMIRDRARRRAH